jgi:hypothetical protein
MIAGLITTMGERTAPIDTTNKFLVSDYRDQVVLLNPPVPRQMLSIDDALLLAAWLVAIAGERKRFLEVLAAVEGT